MNAREKFGRILEVSWTRFVLCLVPIQSFRAL